MRTAALAFALFVSFAAFAQTASETIEVRVTNLDVVVTDRAGNPIPGLTAADFEVIEAGKPQAITNFYEVNDLPAAPVAGATAAAPTEAAAPAVPPARRRIVVYVDNTSISPHARKQMLETFERSLDTLMREGDQATLMLFNGVAAEVLAPLTADRGMLTTSLRAAAQRSGGNAAIESQKNTILDNAEALLSRASSDDDTSGGSSSPAPPDPSQPNTPNIKRSTAPFTLGEAYSMAMSSAQALTEQLWRRQRSLIASLEQTIDSLAPAEGKKVLLFIGGELSDNPGSQIEEQIDAVFASRLGSIPATRRQASRSLTTELRALAARANAANITLYMVDAGDRGSRDASRGSLSRSGQSFHDADTTIAFAHVANLTGGTTGVGGKAFQNTLNTIARDLSAYYSLGYRSQTGGAGTIDVRVKRPGAVVRTRRTFSATPAAAPAMVATASAPAPAPQANVVAPAPAAAPLVADDSLEGRLRANLFDDTHSDFPISVTASEPRPHENGRYQVDLSIKFPSTVKMVEEGASLKGRVAILLITANAEGRTSKTSTQIQELTFPRGSRAQVEAQKTLTYNFPMLVGSGKMTVSVAVADQLAGTSGFARTVITTP